MPHKDKPAGWPESIAAAFAPFASADSGKASPAGGDDANPFMQPFAQSFTGGVDFVKKLWGGLPGSGAVPGFMVPTMDIEELDKRIKDLRTVESWLAMNANMLRATIQGLEVQRNTIAAIQSLGASLSEATRTGRVPEQKAAFESGLPPGWPVGAPREHTPEPAEEQGPQAAAPSPAATPAAEPEPARARPAKTREKPAASSAIPPAGALPELSPANWLGYMQEQFSKVAGAALAAPATPPQPAPSGTKAKPAPAKSRAGRARASRKRTAPRGT